MAKSKTKNKKGKYEDEDTKTLGSLNLKDETLNAVWVIVFFTASIFLGLAALHKAGIAGEKTFSVLSALFGIGYYILPALLIMLAISRIKDFRTDFGMARWIGSGLFLLSTLSLTDIVFEDRGGIIGGLVSTPLLKLIDIYASTTLLIALSAISLIVIFDAHPSFKSLLFWRKEEEDYEDEIDTEKEATVIIDGEEQVSEKNSSSFSLSKSAEKNDVAKEQRDPSGIFLPRGSISAKEYTLPPLSLLEKDKGKPGVGDIKANTNIIKRTLQNFGIDVEMDEISIGPSITRYALKPAEGVKLSRILALQNNLELALAAHPVRIEAPIPGKSLVGIEIPNNVKSTVGLASILGSSEYQDSPKSLLVGMGKGISGKVIVADLAKMPHVLIAGATGAGKSVTIHSFINSLLFRNSPENLRFIMIDPKRVELTLYNNIPHLLTPVITGAKQAILALKWAAKEMDRRYDILESEKVRDIQSYHANILAPAMAKLKKKELAEVANMPETMPYIVVIIDELADIMQAYPRELEGAIVRIAQMSRAVGIHLVLSTQRPSVNVITGLIKANVPSRVALQVASQIDSRTILDGSGAEKLLGAGDMLYLSGEMSKPVRLQSPYVSEDEVKKVVQYLKDNYEGLPDEISLGGSEKSGGNIFEDAGVDSDDDDDLYEEAKETVVSAGKASTSYLQRKLKVGYARAARLMDMLEERGVIGAGDGAKPREVLEKNDNAGFGVGPEEEEEQIY